jgi:hypothetical protein
LPRIQDKLLDSVVYLYPSEVSADNAEKIGGSGFIMGVWSRVQNTVHLYVVTNQHVVRNKDGSPNCQVVRMTSRDNPKAIRSIPDKDWITPTVDDLAISYIGTQSISLEEDLAFISSDSAVKEENRSDYFVGADCFMLGRFISRDGRQRNTPTARFGNISMLPIEPIIEEDGNLTSAFLVETRSQSGFSGSPVFAADTTQLDCRAFALRRVPPPSRLRFLAMDVANIRHGG